jgi:dTDP-4-amino-4,6-dideoxygalactose transaminase
MLILRSRFDIEVTNPKNRALSKTGGDMKVPLLDLQAQFEEVGADVRAQIEDVLSTCQFINGPKVGALEEAVADYVGAKHGIGVSSGTDALLVALMALDVGPNDLVLTTPYSFFATAGAIARLGAEPVFIDIDPQTYNLSGELLRNWFNDNASRLDCVKCCIPVHLYGQSADLKSIVEICSEYGVPIIEDAAQAIGSKVEIDGEVRSAGSVGLIGCYSFFPSKNLGGIGDGGMVVTSDDETAAKIKKLKNHGSHPKYYHQLIGGNFRLDALQAAALLAKLPHLEDWHKARQTNAAYYDEGFADIASIEIPHISQKREYHIYNQYVIRVPRRDELRKFLSSVDIGNEVYYPVPFHLQECFDYLGYDAGSLPEAEKAALETVAIPIYPELTRDMQDYVIDKVREHYA